MATYPEQQLVWYTRRRGVIRGPFSAQHITRYILLGRIRLQDELSANRETWRRVNSYTQLLPAELSDLSSWDNYQQLVVARMLVDERRGERRSATSGTANIPFPERRTGRDRRRNTDSEFVARHLFHRDFSYLARAPHPRRLRYLLLALLIGILVLVLLTASQR